MNERMNGRFLYVAEVLLILSLHRCAEATKTSLEEVKIKVFGKASSWEFYVRVMVGLRWKG